MFDAFTNCTSLTSVTFQSKINAIDLYAFDGDLRDKYFASGVGIGTYTRASGGSVWTKQ